MMKKTILILSTLTLLSVQLFATNTSEVNVATTIIYVDSAANKFGDGQSWNTAYKYLQDAIHQANSVANEINQQEIWVMRGTYWPDEDEGGNQSDNSTSSYFELHDFVFIYGGFRGVELNIERRDLENNRSILDGDLRQNGTSFGNTKHIIKYPNSSLNSPSNGSAILDGFYVRNSGQGNMVLLNSCYPYIQKCIFYDGNKGAVRNISSDPTFINCLFYDNYADTAHCIFNINSSPKIYNCTFGGNDDTYYVDNGMIVNVDSSFPVIKNCILWNNTKLEIIDDSSSISDVSYSIVDGYLGGNNMVYGDPGFVDPVNFNFGISECSNAVNSGTSITGLIRDINNGNRIIDGIIDLGAFENQTGKSYTIIYVDSSNLNPNSGLSWADAFDNLQDALTLSSSTSGCVQIWVAQGTYTPDRGEGYTALDTTASFIMQNAVEIYGGFSGTESSLDQRDIAAFKTVLSGQLDGSNFSTVIVKNIANNLNASSLLDGFTAIKSDSIGILNKSSSPIFKNLSITDHHFTSGSSKTGLSIDSFSIVMNCSFTGNRGVNGTAMQAKGSHSLIMDCLFEDNISTAIGGAMTSSKENIILRCTFKNNHAPNYGSGAVWTNDSKFISCTFEGNSSVNGGVSWISDTPLPGPTFKNCLFNNNTATNHGGAFYTLRNMSINNCTFVNNKADSDDSGFGSGEAIHAQDSIDVINTIFWDNEDGIGPSQIVDGGTLNSSIACCIVEGGFVYGTNIFSDYPEFTDTAFGDYTLKSCSPAIDTGYVLNNSCAVDLAQNPRVHNAKGLSKARTDLGAYEFQMDYSPDCCHTILLLSGPLAPGTYEASTAIVCSGGIVAAGTHVIFSAPEINLRQDFEVIETGIFETQDDGCN